MIRLDYLKAPNIEYIKCVRKIRDFANENTQHVKSEYIQMFMDFFNYFFELIAEYAPDKKEIRCPITVCM